jgi:hypothetical protein
VRERLPVLRQGEDDIKLEVEDVSPAWEKFEPFPSEPHHPRLRGGHRWTVALAPAEEKRLSVRYAIRISSKHELVGGNRREA